MGLSRAVSILRPILTSEYRDSLENVGVNPGHLKNLDVVSQMARKREYSFIKALRGITRNKNFGINFSYKLFPKKLKAYRKFKNDIKQKSTKSDKKRVKSSISSGNVPIFAWVN